MRTLGRLFDATACGLVWAALKWAEDCFFDDGRERLDDEAQLGAEMCDELMAERMGFAS